MLTQDKTSVSSSTRGNESFKNFKLKIEKNHFAAAYFGLVLGDVEHRFLFNMCSICIIVLKLVSTGFKMGIAFKWSQDVETFLCVSYLLSYLVRPVCTKNLLNNLKCQSLLAFKTAVSKMGFVLMGNSKLSLEECTKPVCFLK